MPYEYVPYQAFACPECNSEVKPNQEIFCNSCGVNLRFYKRIEEKTFYRGVYHKPSEYCQKCGQRSVTREVKEWLENFHGGGYSSWGRCTKCSQIVYTCSSCGHKVIGDVSRIQEEWEGRND